MPINIKPIDRYLSLITNVKSEDKQGEREMYLRAKYCPKKIAKWLSESEKFEGVLNQKVTNFKQKYKDSILKHQDAPLNQLTQNVAQGAGILPKAEQKFAQTKLNESEKQMLLALRTGKKELFAKLDATSNKAFKRKIEGMLNNFESEKSIDPDTKEFKMLRELHEEYGPSYRHMTTQVMDMFMHEWSKKEE